MLSQCLMLTMHGFLRLLRADIFSRQQVSTSSRMVTASELQQIRKRLIFGLLKLRRTVRLQSRISALRIVGFSSASDMVQQVAMLLHRKMLLCLLSMLTLFLQLMRFLMLRTLPFLHSLHLLRLRFSQIEAGL